MWYLKMCTIEICCNFLSKVWMFDKHLAAIFEVSHPWVSYLLDFNDGYNSYKVVTFGSRSLNIESFCPVVFSGMFRFGRHSLSFYKWKKILHCNSKMATD